MRISFLSLIIGICVGIFLVGIVYYGIYYIWGKYQAVRHPFKVFSATPPPSQSSISFSEWLNRNEENYIFSENVFLRVGDGKVIAIDEDRKKLKLKNLNSTDKSQLWRLHFYKNPNDPYEKEQGVIYNLDSNKYISFDEDGDIILKDLLEPYGLNIPHGNVNIECTHDFNKISNIDKNVWIYVDQNKIKTTKNRKNASDFFVTIL